MSICDGCIHDDVCGLEDNHEEGIVSCADRIPKDVLDKIRAKIEEYKLTIDNAISEDELKIEGMKEAYADCLKVIDKYKAESEDKE